jgi:hypothetical protein
MTTQISDRLIFDGVEYAIKPFPLNCLNEDWSTRVVDGKRQSRFAFSSTALRRRYVARWLLEDGKLYLIEFTATDTDGAKLGIQDVFGVVRLLAFWYTGELKSPSGERIHGTFEPQYERDRIWELERGRLTSSYVRENKVPLNEAHTRSKNKYFQSEVQAPPLMQVFADALKSKQLEVLSECKRDEYQKKLMAVIEAVIEIKSCLLPNYDINNDLEFETLRDAWQKLVG